MHAKKVKYFLIIVALFTLCEVSILAQGIVWNWVPNPQPNNPVFPGPYGAPVWPGGGNPTITVSVDMTGKDNVDFEIRAILGKSVQVLSEGSNAVLSVPYSAPDIGQEAVLLTKGDQVSSLTPVGAAWLGNINVSPYVIGSDLIAGTIGLQVGGQFINQEGYVGLEFYEADGIHYGALDVAGYDDSGFYAIFYGYGYNPIPGQPFNLNSIPPVPEPSTWTLVGLGLMGCLRKCMQKKSSIF